MFQKIILGSTWLLKSFKLYKTIGCTKLGKLEVGVLMGSYEIITVSYKQLNHDELCVKCNVLMNIINFISILFISFYFVYLLVFELGSDCFIYDNFVVILTLK